MTEGFCVSCGVELADREVRILPHHPDGSVPMALCALCAPPDMVEEDSDEGIPKEEWPSGEAGEPVGGQPAAVSPCEGVDDGQPADSSASRAPSLSAEELANPVIQGILQTTGEEAKIIEELANIDRSVSAMTEVLAGKRDWTVECNDCLNLLRSLPSHSVDAIVTDPPYFLVNAAGTGFMGAEWDSLSIANAVAVACFASSHLSFGRTAAASAGLPPSETHGLNVSAQTAVSASEETVQSRDMECDSAPAVVITLREAEVLCHALSPNLIGCLQKLPTDASFVLPSSFLALESKSTAQRVVAILRDAPVWLESEIRSSSTVKGSSASRPTGVKSGTGPVPRSTDETDGAVDAAASIAVDTKSNATTSSHGDYREIVRRIISLPCASRVIKRCMSDRVTMPLISEWWHEVWAREALRVLKPGGFLLAFGGSRAFHRLCSAVEAAGFDLRDTLMFLHGMGFPKNMNLSKAIDRAAGAERRVIGSYRIGGNAGVSTKDKGGTYGVGVGTAPPVDVPITEPATEEAKKWDGWGTALKPAFEPILLARAPLSEPTLVRNVLRWGTGALNITGTRIFTDWNESDRPDSWKASGHTAKPDADKIAAPPGDGIDCHPLGRWPANLLLGHSPLCRPIGKREVQRQLKAKTSARDGNGIYGDGLNAAPVVLADGVESQDVYDCAPDCPVRMLDEQTGVLPAGVAVRHRSGGNTFGTDEPKPTMDDLGYRDYGTASRFFYVSKPSTAEREFGLENFEPAKVNDGRESEIDNPYQRGETERKNTHFTVKSIALMRWLVRLVTPPGGVVLDPFAGSGTTIIAARREGFRAIGIDSKPAYVAIARARITRWEQVRPEVNEAEAIASANTAKTDERQQSLFGGAM
jgi:site-specific DNA-methyltransferase (adenine-specific)